MCGKETTKKATGNQQHVPDGQAIFYDDAPPAFGEHYNTPDPMERKLYTEGDRPELGILVHNLEHGYTILWYDETVADDSDQMNAAARDRRQVRGHQQPALQVQGRAVARDATASRSPRASTSRSPTGRSAAPTRTRPATARWASGSTAPTSPATPSTRSC